MKKSWHKDISGQKFGKLTAIEFVERKDNKTYWLFKCDCGKETIKCIANVGNGTNSCGCLKIEQDYKNLNLDKSFSNGLYNHKLYNIWESMKDRCYNKNCHAYKDYGERGIRIGDIWMGDDGFINFYNWSLENGYREKLTIDRIEVNGSYEPNNCRWATMKEQGNNRRNNTPITINNETKNLGEWCNIFNLNRKTVSTRIHRGETPLEAITYIINKLNKKKAGVTNV